MSLHETPHTVILEIPQTSVLPEGFAATPHNSGEITLYVQMTPKSSIYALDEYGVNVENAVKMMGNKGDEVWFSMQGARLRWTINERERILHIRSGCRLHGQGDECDHISAMCEEVRKQS